MQGFKKNIRFSVVLTLVALMLVFGLSSLAAAPANRSSTEPFVKHATVGQHVPFTKADFLSNDHKIKKIDAIVITSIPDESKGMLLLDGRVMMKGEAVLDKDFSKLRLVSLSYEDSSISFDFIPMYKEKPAYGKVTMTVHFLKEDNKAPQSENTSVTTEQKIKIFGKISADDPEGDQIFYKLTSGPAKGSLELNRDTGEFSYLPGEKNSGRDSFCFYVSDIYGNMSDICKVNIKIDKSSGIFYTDLQDSPAQYPAIKLSQKDIITGERLADSYLFNPDKVVTRGEFVVMAASVAKIMDEYIPDDGILSSSFSDADTIPQWMRPYVEASVEKGLVIGKPDKNGNLCFNANDVVTAAECTVLANKILGIQDIVVLTSGETDTPNVFEGTPIWAAEAMEATTASGMLPSLPSLGPWDHPMTRELCAIMLHDVVKSLDGPENPTDLLAWARG